MFSEGNGGQCPNCQHKPLVQRYDFGVGMCYQMDACPNCGFGYGVGYEEGEGMVDSKGEKAWVDYFSHLYGCSTGQPFEGTPTELRRWQYEQQKTEHVCEDHPTTVFQYVEVTVGECVPDGAVVFNTIQ